MGWYVNMSDKLPKLKDFPSIDVEKVTDWTNSLFAAFLFRENKKGSLWLGCSACGKSTSLYGRMINGDEYVAMTTPHNQHARCPWCGRIAQIKETRYLRQRKLLKQYVPIMILTEKGGALYGRGYWARKDYQGHLLAKPLFMGTYAYYWGPAASAAYNMDTGILVKEIAGPRYGPKNYLPKPHISGNWCYSIPEDCYVYGAEELAKTRLRYIKSAEFMPEPGSMKAYSRLTDTITLANSYPVATELIMKQGADMLIEDMIYHDRKNDSIINWAAESPRDLLRNVTYKEFSTAAGEGRIGIYILEMYIKFRKAGRPEKLEKIKELYKDESYGSMICEFALQKEISITKVENYVNKQIKFSVLATRYSVVGFWKDMLKMAAELGYNVQDEAIKFPKDLMAAHDKYADQERERKEQQKLEEARERELKAKDRLKTWALKYELEAEGYRIILPRTEKEIQVEGATLRHCVAGYAERHMQGKTTILFLRSSQEPDTSLYTIEMDGNRLKQIHGYMNDRGRENPAKTMAWFIEPWLKWLNAGSKRDAKGREKIKIQRKEISKSA